MTRPQRTLKTAVEFSGPGIHSGEDVHVRILPAPPEHGIVFNRTDIPDSLPIPATIAYHSARDLRTRVERQEAEVNTIEHMLAVCSGLKIDNLNIEISGPELPGLDGSSLEFLRIFQQAGIVDQRADARVYTLKQPVYVRQGNATLVALPVDEPGLTLQYIASFDDPEVEGGSFQVHVTPEEFEKEIAPARTFCLAKDVEMLKAAGFGKGATRENTLVLGDPETKFRIDQEPVRHKLLDLMGDLMLLGADLNAHVIATCSGHSTNAELVRRIIDLMHEEETSGLITRETGLEIKEVMKLLPHRYPFLLIDRVLEIDGYQRAVAIKNVTINEPFFQGHFPEAPLMPGVLQLEALAQLAGVLLLRKLEHTGKLAVLTAIDKVKLRSPVSPGDQLRLTVETIRMRGEIGRVRGTGTVAGTTTVEAELTFAMVDV